MDQDSAGAEHCRVTEHRTERSFWLLDVKPGFTTSKAHRGIISKAHPKSTPNRNWRNAAVRGHTEDTNTPSGTRLTTTSCSIPGQEKLVQPYGKLDTITAIRFPGFSKFCNLRKVLWPNCLSSFVCIMVRSLLLASQKSPRTACIHLSHTLQRVSNTWWSTSL